MTKLLSKTSSWLVAFASRFRKPNYRDGKIGDGPDDFHYATHVSPIGVDAKEHVFVQVKVPNRRR